MVVGACPSARRPEGDILLRPFSVPTVVEEYGARDAARMSRATPARRGGLRIGLDADGEFFCAP